MKMSRPVFVYQMGKVASNSIVRWLADSSGEKDIHHIHFMGEASLAYLEYWRAVGMRRGDVAGIYLKGLTDQIDAGTAARRDYAELLQKKGGGKPLIITGVREPVGYIISAFFQALYLVSPVASDIFKSDEGFSETLCRMLVKQIDNYLSGARPSNNYEAHCHLLIHSSIRWFDWEFKPTIGVSVFEGQFDYETGWQYLEYENWDILYFRYEDCVRSLVSGLQHALGGGRAGLTVENAAKDKHYAALREAFLERFLLPEELFDRMYRTRQVQYFYTQKEISVFKERWAL